MTLEALSQKKLGDLIRRHASARGVVGVDNNKIDDFLPQALSSIKDVPEQERSM